MRQAYRPVLATCSRRRTVPDAEVVVVNAGAGAVTDDLVVERRSFDGTVLASTTASVTVAPADAVGCRCGRGRRSEDPAGEVIVVTGTSSGRRVHDLAEVVDQRLARRPFTTEVERTDDGARVTVTATGYVRDLSLFRTGSCPRPGGRRLLVSLLPGEHVVFTVSRAPGVDVEALVDRSFRHAGDLLH